MYEQKKAVPARVELAERAVWERPELRHLDAGSAEANNGGSTDLGVLS
jgi:hypothetical protein